MHKYMQDDDPGIALYLPMLQLREETRHVGDEKERLIEMPTKFYLVHELCPVED